MKLSVPLSVTIPRKTKPDRKIALNLNIFRNLHHMTNNQAKVIFKELIVRGLKCSQMSCMGKPPYRFTYTLYQASGRATDIANVLSIVDKFTCDALVDLAIISDDNHKILPEVIYRYGGVDKEQPRAELEIESILP